MKKTYIANLKKILYIIPYVCFMSLSDIVLAEPQSAALSEILWYGIFGRLTKGEFQSLFLSVECLGAIFIFGLLFGDYISIFFGKICTIFFTRLQSKPRWIVKKSLCLCALSGIWVLLMLCVKLAIAKRQSYDWAINFELIRTLVVIWLIIEPVVLMICLTINWISIVYGEPISLSAIFAFVMVLEVVAIRGFDNPVNIVVNPLCFNINILYSLSTVCIKSFINLFYLLLITFGFMNYVERKDIF